MSLHGQKGLEVKPFICLNAGIQYREREALRLPREPGPYTTQSGLQLHFFTSRSPLCASVSILTADDPFHMLHRYQVLRPAITPPSISQMAPVTQSVLSESRNATLSAISTGVPTRPIGWKLSKLFMTSFTSPFGMKPS